MKPLFDVQCNNCGHVWEERKRFDDPARCPKCNMIWTTTMMPLMKHKKAKSVDDMLHDRPPDPKPVKSFAHDRRRGGRDTS